MTEFPCICIELRKASRKLTAQYDAALAPAGVQLAQFSLLRNLARHAPISLTELARLTELDRSTLGRNVRILERMDLVQFVETTDQRKTTIDLTEAGRETLKRAMPLWRSVQTSIRNRLGETGRVQLEALLGAL